MKLREALIQQAPSIELQRAAADEIARLDAALVAAVAAERERWRAAIEPVLNASEGELPHALYVLAGFARA